MTSAKDLRAAYLKDAIQIYSLEVFNIAKVNMLHRVIAQINF